MKKRSALILLLTIVISVPVFSQSPVGKGSIMLNGTLSYSNTNVDEYDNNSVNIGIHPQAAYFIIDYLSAGLFFDYERIEFGEYSANDYSIGAALRFYFELENLKPFIGLGFAYLTGNQSRLEGSKNGTKWLFAAGLDYFIVKNVALETVFRYDITNVDVPESYNFLYNDLNYKQNTFFVGFGLNFFIY